MPRTRSRDREVLDSRLDRWRELDATQPPRGWLRALREALGMPRAELARRLGISAQAVAQLETSEADGTVKLATLRRAAAALDATLVYALVPSTSLDATVEQRARTVARDELARVHHTMLLEDQAGREDELARLERELADQLKDSSALWRR